ncbi:MAG: hypothetical protein ACI4QC_07440 [Thermoguttaceae bacterium]
MSATGIHAISKKGSLARSALWGVALCFWFAFNVWAADIRDDEFSERSAEGTADAVSSARSTDSWVLSENLSLVETKMQFRVDNTVRVLRNDRLPQAEREVSFESSTVFYDNLVFDYVGDNGEIVVFSFNEKKFALIDPIRRMRTELGLDEIERFLSRVKPILREKNDKFVNFMIDPSFEISKKEDELFFQSKFIDYHISTRGFENQQIADAYFQFTDALGKLNVYMNPGAVTPLARIEANKRLKESVSFPETIVTDVYPNGKTIFNKTVHIVNESTLARRLSERDRNRVNRTIHFFAQFPMVNFQTYFEKTAER